MKSTVKEIVKNLNELGSKEAIIIDGKRYSYEFLRGRVSALSRIIAVRSEKEERIGLHLENNIDCYIGLISLLVSGRSFVPISESFGKLQNQHMLGIGDITKIIQTSNSEFIDNFSKEFELEQLKCVEESKSKVELIESENAYLLFTSGSTGNPKGVPITHANIDQFVNGISNGNEWSFYSNDRFLQPFSLAFDLFVFTVYLPLSIGATFVSVPQKNIALMSASSLELEKITVSLLVPSTMKIINKVSHSVCYDSLRLSFFCGEALYASDLEDWIKNTPNATQINIYGPTEATAAVTKYIWNEKSNSEVKNDIVPIGVPFGNNILSLLESTEGNELLLGGPQVFSKYVGTTKDPFIKIDNTRFYKTGDICEINENGNYLFIGRKDSQVKVDGYRIEISDVENKLKKVIPGRQIVVVHLSNAEKLCSLHAFITGDPIEELKSIIKDSVPDYMCPRTFNFIDSIPLNLNGKTDRKKLKSMI